uniref:Uncharacterized protein n=1 Tax=viral metagenome TaxID=1070528 RepID=A0A6C0BDH5_9ZZZZ
MTSFNDFYDRPQLLSLYDEYISHHKKTVEELSDSLLELEILKCKYDLQLKILDDYSVSLSSHFLDSTSSASKFTEDYKNCKENNSNFLNILKKYKLTKTYKYKLMVLYRKYISKKIGLIFKKFPLQLLIDETGDVITILSSFKEGVEISTLSFPNKLYNAVYYLSKFIRDEDSFYEIPTRLYNNILHMKPHSRALEIYKNTNELPDIRIQNIIRTAINDKVTGTSLPGIPFLRGINLDKFSNPESDINDYVIDKISRVLLDVFPFLSYAQIFDFALNVASSPINERVERSEILIEYLLKTKDIEGSLVFKSTEEYRKYLDEQKNLIDSLNVVDVKYPKLGPSISSNMTPDIQNIFNSNMSNASNFNIANSVIERNFNRKIIQYLQLDKINFYLKGINDHSQKFNLKQSFSSINSDVVFSQDSFIANIVKFFNVDLNLLRHYISISPQIFDQRWFLKFSDVVKKFPEKSVIISVIDYIYKLFNKIKDVNHRRNFTKSILNINFCKIPPNTKSSSNLSVVRDTRYVGTFNNLPQQSKFNHLSQVGYNVYYDDELDPEFIFFLDSSVLDKIFKLAEVNSIDHNIIVELKMIDDHLIDDIIILTKLSESKKLFNEVFSFIDIYRYIIRISLANGPVDKKIHFFTRIAKMLLFRSLVDKESFPNFEKESINHDQDEPLMSYVNVDQLNKTVNMRKYKETIDVHDEYRDENTDLGVITMIRSYNLSEDEVKTEFSEFWERAAILPEFSRKIFDRLMGYDKDMKKLLCRYEEKDDDVVYSDDQVMGNDDNNGFLTSQIDIQDNLYDPKLVIASFWKFCKEFPQNKLTDSLFAGIMSSYQLSQYGEWYCVCNPGKLQNMAINVLQGRILVKSSSEKDAKLVPLMIDDISIFDRIKERVTVQEKSPALIYSMLKPFISDIVNGNVPSDVDDFYKKLFQYIVINNLDITCEEAVRVTTLYAETKNGFDFYPSLSVASGFEYSIDTEEYLIITEHIKFMLTDIENQENDITGLRDFDDFDDFDDENYEENPFQNDINADNNLSEDQNDVDGDDDLPPLVNGDNNLSEDQNDVDGDDDLPPLVNADNNLSEDQNDVNEIQNNNSCVINPFRSTAFITAFNSDYDGDEMNYSELSVGHHTIISQFFQGIHKNVSELINNQSSLNKKSVDESSDYLYIRGSDQLQNCINHRSSICDNDNDNEYIHEKFEELEFSSNRRNFLKNVSGLINPLYGSNFGSCVAENDGNNFLIKIKEEMDK